MAARRPTPIDWTDPLATISVSEFATRARMSVWSAYRAVRRGTSPPVVYVGGSPRMRAVDVIKWLELGGENAPGVVAWLQRVSAERERAAAS